VKYCKNCNKYSEMPSLFLERPNIYNPSKTERYGYGLCKMRNDKGNCPDYERKWWKFWIREGV